MERRFSTKAEISDSDDEGNDFEDVKFIHRAPGNKVRTNGEAKSDCQRQEHKWNRQIIWPWDVGEGSYPTEVVTIRI